MRVSLLPALYHPSAFLHAPCLQILPRPAFVLRWFALRTYQAPGGRHLTVLEPLFLQYLPYATGPRQVGRLWTLLQRTCQRLAGLCLFRLPLPAVGCPSFVTFATGRAPTRQFVTLLPCAVHLQTTLLVLVNLAITLVAVSGRDAVLLLYIHTPTFTFLTARSWVLNLGHRTLPPWTFTQRRDGIGLTLYHLPFAAVPAITAAYHTQRLRLPHTLPGYYLAPVSFWFLTYSPLTTLTGLPDAFWFSRALIHLRLIPRALVGSPASALPGTLGLPEQHLRNNACWFLTNSSVVNVRGFFPSHFPRRSSHAFSLYIILPAAPPTATTTVLCIAAVLPYTLVLYGSSTTGTVLYLSYPVPCMQNTFFCFTPNLAVPPAATFPAAASIHLVPFGGLVGLAPALGSARQHHRRPDLLPLTGITLCNFVLRWFH